MLPRRTADDYAGERRSEQFRSRALEGGGRRLWTAAMVGGGASAIEREREERLGETARQGIDDWAGLLGGMTAVGLNEFGPKVRGVYVGYMGHNLGHGPRPGWVRHLQENGLGLV